MEHHKSLQRSRTDSIIAGVAGGIANYLNLDPTIIRVIFVLLALFGGGGVLIYLILWVAVPSEPIFNSFNSSENTNNPDTENPEADNQQDNNNYNTDWSNHPKKQDGSLIAGLALITIGTIFLVDHFVPRIDFADLWPIILLVAGIALIRIGYTNKKKENNQ